MTDYSRNIEKGIQFLNNYAQGWLERINLETLDVSCCQHCVLAQATSMEFHVATYELDLDFKQLVDMGFSVNPEGTTLERVHEELSILNQQWYFQIYRLKQVTACKK